MIWCRTDGLDLELVKCLWPWVDPVSLGGSLHPPGYSWFPLILCVAFMVCTVPYTLAGDFCMGSVQPTLFWRRSDLPAWGKREQDGMRVHLCLPHSVRVCLCARACTNPARAALPHLRSALWKTREEISEQQLLFIPQSKWGGGRGGVGREGGGREGCRKEERESQMGEMKGGWGDILTHISLYLAFCIQDGLAHISIFLSVCLSVWKTLDFYLKLWLVFITLIATR